LFRDSLVRRLIRPQAHQLGYGHLPRMFLVGT
jgi:hypothetical protein